MTNITSTRDVQGARERERSRLTHSLCSVGEKMGIFSAFTFGLGRLLSGPHAWIVTFHDVGDIGEALTYGTSTRALEEAICYFKRHFQVVPLKHIVDLVGQNHGGSQESEYRGGRPLLAITFDDGRRSLLTHALPVLRKHGVSATAFLISKTLDPSFAVWTDIVERLVAKLDRVELPKYLGYQSSIESSEFCLKREAVIKLKSYLRYVPHRRRELAIRDMLRVNGVKLEELSLSDLYLSRDDIVGLVESGVDIGSHSHTHEVFSLLSQEEARSELITSKRVLEEVSGRPVECFAFPNGTEADFRPQDISLAREAGYRAALTTLRGAVALEPGQFVLPRIEAPGGYEEQPLAKFSAVLAFESMMGRKRQQKLQSLALDKRRVNVLYIIDYLHPEYAGGTETQLESTIRNADRDLINPHLCIVRGEAPEDFKCPVTVLGVHRLLGPGLFKATRNLVRLMRQEKIDVAHLQFFDSVVLGTIAAKVARVPVVITARRGIRSLATTRAQMSLVTLLDRVTTSILSNSFAVMRCVVQDEKIPARKAYVLHNGLVVPDGLALPPAEAKMELGLKPGEMGIGIISNLRHVKGVDIFLRAAALVAKEEPLVRFLIFGEGELREELGRLKQNLGIANVVEFRGFKQNAFALVPGFDVAVVSSRSEGCSNALLEYCFTGSAIVATDVGGNAEIIVHEESGLLVPPEDEASLAAAIVRLLRDSHLRTRLGTQARKDASMRFMLRDAMRQLWCLYWRLLHT